MQNILCMVKRQRRKQEATRTLKSSGRKGTKEKWREESVSWDYLLVMDAVTHQCCY